MLNEEEVKIFLALLAEFCAVVRLSDRQVAKVLGASHASVSRWMRMHSELPVRLNKVCRHTALPAQRIIEKLNKIDRESNLYQQVADKVGSAKTSMLLGALNRRTV